MNLVSSFKGKTINMIGSICKFMDTWYFAVALAIIELFSYYLGLDLLIIFVISFFISFSLIFKNNLNCLVTIFLFMSSMISLKNSPASVDVAGTNPDYFLNPVVFIPTIILAVIPVSISLIVFIRNLITGKIEINKLFGFTLILGCSFLINGLMDDAYNPLNAIFGLFLFFFFVVLFFAILPRMSLNKDLMISLSKQISIFSITIVFELVVFYCDALISGEDIYPRFSTIVLGWGNRNTIGFLLTVSLCFTLYLTLHGCDKITKIFGITTSFFSILAIAMSFSRQAYLATTLIVISVLLYGFLKSSGKTKKLYLFGLLAFGIIILSLVAVVFFLGLFEKIFEKVINDTRVLLWKNAFECFKNNFIFGAGFYLAGGDPIINLGNIMPYCCHNTIFQILGSCGILGLIAYGFYRIVTIKEIFKRKSGPKLLPILALLTLLFLSLLDIHIFDLLGTAIYIALLALCLSKNDLTDISETI